MVTEIMDLNRNMMLSIDVIPVPTDEAVREAESRLLGVETNITNWQRKQNQNNNFSATIPYDMEQQKKEMKEFLDDLTTRDQRMMFAVITMVHTADTKEQLDNDTEAILTTVRKNMCQFAPLKFQQMDGLQTAMPFGVRKINCLRTLTTESLCYSRCTVTLSVVNRLKHRDTFSTLVDANIGLIPILKVLELSSLWALAAHKHNICSRVTVKSALIVKVVPKLIGV